MPKIQVPQKLMPFIHKKKRFKVAIGGRGSGKSHTIADMCLMDAQTKGMKMGMFREFQNSIDDSVYSLLCTEIERLELEGFDVQANKIYTESGGTFTFKGLARNPESIKSMAGYKRFVIEEAQTISQKSLQLLTPTLREDESEVWLIANPRSSGDPFSQRFIVPFQEALERDGYYEDELHLIVVCNYMDNPFFPSVLEEERVFDYENKSRALYDHIWLGKFLDTVDDAIILAEWFDACVDAHEKLGFNLRGKKVVSHDPSDLGGDAKGFAYRHGVTFLDIAAKETGDVNDGLDWATDKAIHYGAQAFVWDCDGLGGALRREVSNNLAGHPVEQIVFKGSHSPDRPDAQYEPTIDNAAKAIKNKDLFKNKRAQYYWDLRDRIYRTYRAVAFGEYADPDSLISFRSKIDQLQQLRSEICRIPRKWNGAGTIQIMTKPEMRALDIPSPNMADSVMMSLAISDRIVKKKRPQPKRMSIV